jgi:hypothetical protein
VEPKGIFLFCGGKISSAAPVLEKFKNCLKLYLSFECWVNEPHPRSQVNQSSEALGIFINLIKECFPRDEGRGWNLPKMHDFVVGQFYCTVQTVLLACQAKTRC